MSRRRSLFRFCRVIAAVPSIEVEFIQLSVVPWSDDSGPGVSRECYRWFFIIPAYVLSMVSTPGMSLLFWLGGLPCLYAVLVRYGGVRVTTLISKKMSDSMIIRRLGRTKCSPAVFCVHVNVRSGSKCVSYPTRRSVRVASCVTGGCNYQFRVISLRSRC